MSGGLVVPRQQLVDLALGMIGDAGDGVAQPGFGIDLVELGGLDEAVDGGGAVAALIEACEQPVLATDRDAPQRALGSVVVDLELAVVNVASERGPARQGINVSFRSFPVDSRLSSSHPAYVV
jgi:hypothetical protein